MSLALPYKSTLSDKTVFYRETVVLTRYNLAFITHRVDMSLNSKQIRFLRAQAHSLKAVVIIGGAGLTDNVINEIHQALDDHELIKVRINADDKQNRQAIIDSIVHQTEANHIQTIGHIGIFYRMNKENPVIQVP